MTVTVAKKFDFHAAHRLPHHDGQCRRLHGHTYGLEVAVTGPVCEQIGASNEGMVLDFTVLKDLYKMLIEPHVEHQNLNHTLASPALEVPFPVWTTAEDDDYIQGDHMPLTTAEALAVWALDCFRHGLFRLMGLSELKFRIEVTVWETPTSYCQVGSRWRPEGA